MRVSAIDIGTNTILMLVADIARDGRLTVVRDEHAIARLGQGVDASRNITAETFERVLAVLSRYKTISEDLRADKLVACGTSALRDARNKKEVIDVVREKLGITIEVLSGDAEAQLTYVGALSGFEKKNRDHSASGNAVLDIGGGSTEVTVGAGGKVERRWSIDVGSVRLTERILKTSPPSAEALDEATQAIRMVSKDLPRLAEDVTLIGVAGTATTLSALAQQLPEFDANRVDQYRISIDSIRAIFDELKTKRREEIERYPQILSGRADIIVAGVLIMVEMMKRLGKDELTVSTRGLRYGIAMREAGKEL